MFVFVCSRLNRKWIDVLTRGDTGGFCSRARIVVTSFTSLRHHHLYSLSTTYLNKNPIFSLGIKTSRSNPSIATPQYFQKIIYNMNLHDQQSRLPLLHPHILFLPH